MALDRVLIRDTDHLAHFTADLTASLSSAKFADVVLRCATTTTTNSNSNNNKGKGASASKKVSSYPTIRVHRAVLAAMSDFMAELILPHPLEEDVHITLDQTAYEVARRIVDFAYAGEVKIAKQLVTSVCDAAHRLQIKFLKDSFVKVTDKDYAAMKAGKKTLETIQKEIKGGAAITAAASSPFKKPTCPTAKGKKGGKRGGKGGKAESDTDSADSEDEAKNIKVPAGGVVTSKPSTKAAKGSKAKSETVMFTLTKQVEDDSTKTVSDNGKFLVHFNQKKENVAPARGKGAAAATAASKIPASLASLVPQPRQIAIPSSVASIQQPLPPSALSKVKKVMIPPMMRKPIVAAMPSKSGVVTTSPTFTLAAGGRSPNTPQRVIALNTFQVHTIKQPDGTQIQVLKQPSGSIMKQLKSTNKPPAGATILGPPLFKKVTPSREPPKDALAIAMEAIAGRGGMSTVMQRPISVGGAIQLPRNPIPMTRIVLPTTPVPPSGFSLPAKPLPVSAISGLKKVDLSSLKAIVPTAAIGGRLVGGAKGSAVAPPTIAILQHPPGYAPVNRVVGKTVISQGASLLPASITASRYSVSQHKLGIPSTVPDDFLMTEDSSEGSTNASAATNSVTDASTNKSKKSESAKAAAATKAAAAAAGKKSGAAAKAKDNRKGAAAALKGAAAAATPARGSLAKELLDSSLSRSSGRVRKINPKYTEGEQDDGDDKSNASSNVSKKSDKGSSEAKGKKAGAAASKSALGSRKRKASSDDDDDKEEEEASPPKKVASGDGSKRNVSSSRSSSKDAASSRVAVAAGSKGGNKKVSEPSKAQDSRKKRTFAAAAASSKDSEDSDRGKRLRKRRDL